MPRNKRTGPIRDPQGRLIQRPGLGLRFSTTDQRGWSVLRERYADGSSAVIFRLGSVLVVGSLEPGSHR